MADPLLFQAYDEGFITRFTPAPATVQGRPGYTVAVPNVAAPVPIGVGLPAEWYRKVGAPYISISRGMPMPDLARNHPAWRGQEVVGTNVIIQKTAPQAVNLPYTVELAAKTIADANAMMQYLLSTALPVLGFGTLVTVLGRDYPFRAAGSKDRTDYASTDEGRLFRYSFDYVVEGWVFTTDGDTVPQVLTITQTLETYQNSVDLSAAVPANADGVDTSSITAPD